MCQVLTDLASACRLRPLSRRRRADIRLLMRHYGISSIRVDDVVFECVRNAPLACRRVSQGRQS